MQRPRDRNEFGELKKQGQQNETGEEKAKGDVLGEAGEADREQITGVRI